MSAPVEEFEYEYSDIASLANTEPVELVELDVEIVEPPEGSWAIETHNEAYKADPAVVLGSINGFSTCVPSVIGTFAVPGTSHTRLPVRREVAPLLIGFAAEFNRLVEKLDGYGSSATANDCWGYACRKVRGRNVISFHSGGIAIDLNATKHVLGRVGTFSAAQRKTILTLCSKYGLRWGGTYSGRKDEMHFEIIVSRAVALQMVKRLQAPVAAPVRPAPAPAKPAPGIPACPGITREGMRNSAVTRAYQAKLRARGWNYKGKLLVVDGDHGPGTTAVLKSFQKEKGLVPDGVGGPNTWRVLWTAPVT